MTHQNKKIKILYTIPNFDTAGSGIALMKLIQNIDLCKFEPNIACLHNRGAYFQNVVKLSGIKVYVYPYIARLRPISALIKDCWRISRFFRKEKFDIVFSYNYSADYSEAIAAKLAGCKFMYVKKNMSWKGSSHNGWKLKSLLANGITVQNTDMMRDFFNNNKKARLISIGVDADEFFQRPIDNNLRKELGISEFEKVIICVANITPKKGIDFLLRGISLIERDIKLIIIGDYNNPFGMKMLELRDILKLPSDRVIFMGKRSDVSRFYSIADLFILPSIGDEGAPIVIQEAMSMGIIVIATDVTGNRDQLDTLPGQLIPICSAESIAQAIDFYLNISPSNKTRIINRQLEIIEERYSLKSEVEKHEQFYLEIMNCK